MGNQNAGTEVNAIGSALQNVIAVENQGVSAEPSPPLERVILCLLGMQRMQISLQKWIAYT